MIQKEGPAAEPVNVALTRAGGLRPVMVGLILGYRPDKAARMTALLVDLVGRRQLRLRRADADSSQWLLERCRDTTDGSLAPYEETVLRTLFRRASTMWLADFAARRRAVRRAYALLERTADDFARLTPSRMDVAEAFDRELHHLEPASLDAAARRDYLPYVLVCQDDFYWPQWGDLRPYEDLLAPPTRPGRRPEPADMDVAAEYEPSVVANVLLAVFHPIFEAEKHRDRERAYRRAKASEWRDANF